MIDKEKKMIFSIGIVFLVLAIVSFSYAYFTATLVNNNVKDQVVQTGTLELTYTDGPEIVMNNIKPGTTITKEISVKNTGTLDISYNLVWKELVNEITNDEMVIEATCTRMDAITETESGSCNSITTKPIKDENIRKNITIEPSIVHKYDITITFKETNESQNYNQGKKFSGVLGVSEFKLPSPVYCTFDGEMVQGAEYVNGRYTYRYKQQGGLNERLIEDWQDMSDDGWGVRVVGNAITDPIIDKMCTYINDKPVISMSYLFSGNYASSIDLSSFDTSNVTDMSYMFYGVKATELDLSNLDTSNVTDMSYMFYNSKATTLDLSSFDTSKVTSMYRMFAGSAATTLNLSSFDTSNVTSMYEMFSGSAATTLDLSNFDTSKVTSMYGMFTGSAATTLDLNSFNTSKVTNMKHMFSGSAATTINLSSFDTSKVTDMYSMFEGSKATTLDLSSFDTTNVINMSYMFYNITNLKTIYASDKFNTNSVTSSSNMFTNSSNLVGGAGTIYDGSYVDKTYARIDGGYRLPGYFTLKNNE